LDISNDFLEKVTVLKKAALKSHGIHGFAMPGLNLNEAIVNGKEAF
jgi:hypothetical protein